MKTILTGLALAAAISVAPAFAQDARAEKLAARADGMAAAECRVQREAAQWDFERQRTDGSASPFFRWNSGVACAEALRAEQGSAKKEVTAAADPRR